MRPRLELRALRRVRAWEYLLRFAFGGAVTVATALVARAGGPDVGGLFLAFPAILPASLTLVARHDGRRQATQEARGAFLGAFALAAFAVVAELLAPRTAPAVTLLTATATWLVTAVLAWTIHERLRHLGSAHVPHPTR